MPVPRRNIEFKATDPDPPNSLSVCLTLGAKDEGWLHQTDTYFCVSSGRLKLRDEGDSARLIYYERGDEAVVRESRYTLIEITDPDALKAALAAALGVRVVVQKIRRLLLWENVRIHLDNVAGLGDFIEIEAVADSLSDLEAERLKATKLQDALGITSERLVAWGYADRLLASSIIPSTQRTAAS